MVVSKDLTHFCYPIRLVLSSNLNSYVAYPGIPSENSNHTWAISAPAIVPSSQITLIKLVHQNEDFQPVSHWNFT